MAATPKSLRAGQIRTLVLLFAGYAACYYCRADLSVATPLLAEELGKQGIGHDEALVRIGGITSLGVFAYALGKFFLTGLGDYWGGRRNFLIGVGGAALFTTLFGLAGGLPLFTLAWIGNRLTQSLGWAGLVKVSSKWFNYTSYGSILGILSISYLVGDALARQQMQMLIEHGYGWRALFFFAALVAAVTLVANFLLLRESRIDEGHPQAIPNPQEPVREHRGAARRHRRTAAAAAAQPRLPAGVPAVLRLHDHPRDLQHLDAGVPARPRRVQREPRRGLQRHIPGRGRRIGAGGRLAQRPARS